MYGPNGMWNFPTSTMVFYKTGEATGQLEEIFQEIKLPCRSAES